MAPQQTTGLLGSAGPRGVAVVNFRGGMNTFWRCHRSQPLVNCFGSSSRRHASHPVNSWSKWYSIPTLSGSQMLNLIVFKLYEWYSSSPTAVSSVLRGAELIHFDHVMMWHDERQ